LLLLESNFLFRGFPCLLSSAAFAAAIYFTNQTEMDLKAGRLLSAPELFAMDLLSRHRALLI
jgi:hypothetical protein